MKKTKLILGLLVSVLSACAIRPPQAKAQYLGTTSPQTEQSTLATNLLCTGAPQNFTTGITPGFNNLGQTQHFASIAASASVTSLQMVIQGIDNSGNVFAISDVGQVNGTVTGSGYFPNIRVVVTCLPITGRFSLSYSGASSTPNVNAGSFLSSQIDKLIFRNADATANNAGNSITTPFGSSSGKILFQFGSAQGGATPTITVQCAGSVTLGNYDQFGFILQSNISIQQFTIPASQCPSLTVGFGAAGAPAGTFSLEYVFDTPGVAPSSSQLNGCMGTTGTGVLVNATPITVGANTTVRIVAPATNERIGVCSLLISVGVAGTIQITEGTGATCGGGTTNLSGAMTLAVGTPLPFGAPSFVFGTNLTGDGLCITTAGGATAAGLISFQYLPI